MKTIEFLNKEYFLPTDWHELSIQKYTELSTLPETDDEVEKVISMLSVLLEVEEEILERMPHKFLNIMMSEVEFIYTTPVVNEVKSFIFEGEEYFVKNIVEGTIGQFAEYTKYKNKFKNNSLFALPYYVAILCQKKGEQHGDYDTDERAEKFKQLPFLVVQAIANFFLNSLNESMNTMQIKILLKQELQRKTKSLQSSIKNMDGKTFSSRWRREISQKLMKSLEPTLLHFLTLPVGDQTLINEMNHYVRLLKEKQK